MRYKAIALFVVSFALASFHLAEAQQAKKVPRIGFLSSTSAAAATRELEAFRQGLREHGYVELKGISIEYRWADGALDRLPKLAAELVLLGVDVIVAGPGNAAPAAAKAATKTIPIVMVSVIDPVSTGLVASLARPGANVTGLTFDVTPEQAGKAVELLKETVPKASRVAILRNPNLKGHVSQSKEAYRVANSLGIKVQFAEVRDSNDKDLEAAFDVILAERANALLASPWAFFVDRRQQIVNFATRNKLPGIYWRSEFVEAGGLVSYGANPSELWRRSATYVDKLLKGTKPADLPVEQPTKFELVISLKTAKQMGLTIPQNLLARADKIIK